MNSRRIAMSVAFLGLLYATPPLLAKPDAPEVCCSESGECPDGLACLESSSCDPESPGYCVVIEPDRH